MSLYRGGSYWYYCFEFRKRKFQGSTHQRNKNKAKLVEAKIRSDVALEHFGIGPVKQSPLFKDFMEGRFLDHVRQHNAQKPRTVLFYTEKTRRLLEYTPFVTLRMSDIDEQAVADYALQRKGVAIASINGELRTLRKAVLLAFEWRLITRRPRIRTLPGEHKREFVLTQEMEAAYLAIADYPLKQAAILMLDLGLRPEECVSLRKSDMGMDGTKDRTPFSPRANSAETIAASMIPLKVSTNTNRLAYDMLTVRSGKTKNAVRTLPLTKRCAEVIQLLFDLWPESEWLFPGMKGKHLSRGSLDNAHARLIRAHPEFPAEFVLYTFRHSFATRLAESGAQQFEIAKILGHSSIVTSQRYVHIGSDSVSRAMAQKELFDRHMRDERHVEPPNFIGGPASRSNSGDSSR